MARRFKAFICYSHADERRAAWLQRALENYAVPRRLQQSHPDVPSRLYPVFRDREELGAAGDLSQSIRDALADSEALIVLCSPAARRSNWVDKEIVQYRLLHPQGRVLAVICDGSPEPSDPDTAFPRALLQDAEGKFLPEPLAADIRPEADGKRGALLKIAAGLLDVGVDELRQRDHQRRLRMLTAIAGGSVLMALIMLLLAINAITARREADIRRAQAEDLIQFMLVELRTQLEPIGKLSILDAVGDQAMTYFSALGDIGTGAEQLARAMALRQIGEVRFNQGRLDAALTAFSESRDITAALYESSHENDQILFQLGQSEFWMGYVAWNRNELRAARASMQAYYHATEELARRAPDNDEYLLEPGYAASNLGSIAREQGDYAGALVHFTDSVHTIEQLLDSSRGDRTRLLFALSESLSWLGSAQLDSGELAASEKSFRRALSILRELHQASPLASYDEAIGDQSLLLGEVLMHRGRLDEGKAALQEAGQRCSRLVRQDADNAYWQRCLHRSRAMLAEVALLQGQPEAAGSLIEQSMSGYAQLLDRDPTNSRLQQQMALAEITAAQELMLTARREEALTLASRAYRRAQEALPDTRAPASSLLRAAVVAERYGRLLHLDNQQAEASAIWREALERMGDGPETIPHTALRMQLLLDLQREREAAPLQLLLQEKGFVDPRFVSAVESVTTGAVFHAD